MKIQHIAAATFMIGSLALIGCQNDGGGSASAGSGSRLVGSGANQVPEGARKLAESRSRLVHRPLREGKIYVADTTTNQVIYSGPVRANSNVVVDAKAGTVAVNDIDVNINGKLDNSHKYALYFIQQ